MVKDGWSVEVVVQVQVASCESERKRLVAVYVRHLDQFTGEPLERKGQCVPEPVVKFRIVAIVTTMVGDDNAVALLNLVGNHPSEHIFLDTAGVGMLGDQVTQPWHKTVPVRGHVLNERGLVKHGDGLPAQKMATAGIKRLPREDRIHPIHDGRRESDAQRNNRSRIAWHR